MNLNLTTATRYGLNVLVLLGVSIALYLGASIFIPVVIAVLLATILYPAAGWFHSRLRFPWFFACLTSILVLVFLTLAIFTAIGAAVPQLMNKVPTTERQWKQKYTDTASRLSDVSPFPIDGILPQDPENSQFYQSVKKLFSPESLSLYLQKLLAFGAEQLSQVVLILFVTLFLMLEGEMLAKKGRAIFGPSTDSQARVTRAIAEIAEAVRTYLVWRTIVNLGLAIVVGIIYKYVFKMEQWYLWAIITAMLNYIPYIGTIAAGVPPMIELLISGRPDAALAAFFFYGCIVTIEGYLIVPWVMGRSMDLNATTVMLACLFWHLLWGVAGLFLAMPLMAALKAVCMHVEEWNAWGQLMSSGPATPAAATGEDVELPDLTPPAKVEVAKPVNS
jgi:AI-2 transport protein TqsA